MVPVDGLWIDMNEPSSFFDGRDEVQSVEFKHHGAGFDPVNPPYDIRNAVLGKGLNHRTLSMATQHHNGVLHYDLHNLYGFTESIVTRKSLLSLRPGRPFVLSRSTFPGSGVHAGHWTGDNAATWNDLKWSISAMLEFQMYGIPYVGADICGFQGVSCIVFCLL